MQSPHLEKDFDDSCLHVFPMHLVPSSVNLSQPDRSNVSRLKKFWLPSLSDCSTGCIHAGLDSSVLLNCLTGQVLAGPPGQKICQYRLIASTCQTFTWSLVASIGTNVCLVSRGVWIELKSSIGYLAFHNYFECWNVQFVPDPTKLGLIKIACLMAWKHIPHSSRS